MGRIVYMAEMFGNVYIGVRKSLATRQIGKRSVRPSPHSLSGKIFPV
jgi:hypothetical protein